MERVAETNYYLDIAESLLERRTYLRRNFGAIIVKNDEIISTGSVEHYIQLVKTKGKIPMWKMLNHVLYAKE